MNIKTYSIPGSALKGTFFHGKNCSLKPSQIFKLIWCNKSREYVFFAPVSILSLDVNDSQLFFIYWEKRIKKQKVNPEYKKNIRLLFHSLRSSRSLESMKKHYLVLPAGKYHDLDFHFEKICRKFMPDFQDSIQLWWSRKPLRTYWGKYISDGPAIVINRLLDSSRFPGYIIEYILYHELIHHVLEPAFEESNYRHSSKFRAYMENFPHEKNIRQELKAMAKSFSRKEIRELL